MAEPILKWAGGKRQILHEIVALMPKDFRNRTFHEPFFGGGAVTFWMEPKRGTINDINPKLINFYVVVRDHVDELIEDAKGHRNEKEYFYKAREEFNEIVRNGFEIPNIRLASLLLYLNKTAFNGLYRENRKGEFNVPFGRYKNPKIVDEERLRKASEVLKKLDIYNEDFTYILRVAKPGDLVYFDPPYHPVSETASFTSYSKEDFSKEDQERLRDVCLELHERGVYFILSNSYVKPVRELYEGIDGFEILKIYAKRPINSKADRRGEVPEMLVTNVPVELQMGLERAKLLVNNGRSKASMVSKPLVEYLTVAERSV
ncbi:DNA adenine methylase [Thermococcus sp. ES12]|uniref:DNA adenine methylase n=1 Tax=Thermococcus sp. ES12 TaxID=1638246 RepID=UPI001431BA8E|nr:DNA adenine methylase [Thermococcus sp. ES12]NJE76360.1 DNA adenine methylase [Thermococcus sp. ES12]